MLRHVANFDTGLSITITDNGYEYKLPNGEAEAYDVFGERIAKSDELSVCAKEGDYIECVPDDDYFVVSSMDSGYCEEQRIDVKKATKWRVIENKDGFVEVVSAKSVGPLKLHGLPGYLNSAYILGKISQACVNDKFVLVTWNIGCGIDTIERLHMDDISIVKACYPYSEANYEDDLEFINRAGIKLDTVNGIWLSSRHLSITSGNYYFGVRVLKPNGEVTHECLNKSYIAGEIDSKTACYDVFPIMVFSPFTKVESGKGTEDDPYKLII